MIVIECPNCRSKFRFVQPDPAKTTYMMRCSVCRHVFEHTIDQGLSLEEEFDLLVQKAGTRQDKEQESPTLRPTEQEGIVETPGDVPEAVEEGAQVHVEGEEPPTESVMREIDSILGAAEETAVTEEEAPVAVEETSRTRTVLKAAAAVACIVVIAAALGWFFKDRILPLSGRQDQGLPSQPKTAGPFFEIDERNVTHELLTHEQEGAVLVIRGTLRKISGVPVESVMVEARVYDRAGALMEKRIAYAGIVPDTSEFVRQPRADIDALLTSDPATPGSTLPGGDIPFAVAFFGKTAREASSYQVEVKDIRWRQ
ncbi:MAG TPA: DUF3426 domain-containing protein [Deltaproteobacteria bacterium]|nr:DUF3426 domain-containing protein [Deltaproteobacteria bacterium]HPP79371.1 DUF3426 domain-containing protein [Deltaproteobacteria bacterium]